MAETKTITVPIGYEGPAQPAQQERPEWARKSLHAVKMPRREVELAPEWVDNGPNVEVKWAPVEQSPPDTNPTESEFSMEDQYSNNQQVPPVGEQPTQGATQPPDPMSYDFYDSNDVARFHQDNSAYYQQLVDQRVQAHLTPHMDALQEAKWRGDYNACVERYAEDPNFKKVMEVALERVADEKGKISIMEAYIEADNKDRAKPGVKHSAHLPEALRDRKRGIASLGKIMFHNAQTGRARPFPQKRGW